MKATKIKPNLHLWHSGWRVVAFATLLAAILYFLPIHTAGNVSPVLKASSPDVPVVEPALPFGLQLLAYARAATTTLELSKTGPITATPNQQISYQLTLTNSGSISAEGVIVTDAFPQNTNTPVLGFPPPGWGIYPPSSNTEISWFSGNPMPPTSTVKFSFQINVDSPLPNGTIITNTYTVTAANATTLVKPGFFTTVIRAPEFAPLTKTVAPAFVTPGNLLTYTLTVANAGAYRATGVVVTDTIPAHTSYFNSVPPASAPAGSAGSVITWTIAQIAAGQTATLTLQVQTDPVITNGLALENRHYRASSSSVFTPVVGTDLATATVASAPALTLTKQATATTVAAGDYLSYRITVTNQSTATDYGRNIRVVDNLPPETVFVSAGISGGTATIDAPTPGSTGPVTFTVTSPVGLNAGDSLLLDVRVQVQSPLTNGTVITNTYSMTAANISTEISGPPVTTTITSSPQISLTKIVEPPSVLAGQPVTYTVIVTNSGNATAYNVPFTDTLPTGFSPATVNRTQTITGVGLLKQPVVVTFTIVATTGSEGGQFANLITATVAGVPIASGPVATVTVIPQVFTVTKTAAPEPVVPGSTLTYTITITNRTNTAQTAVITENYPAEITFNSASPSPDAGNNRWQLNVEALSSTTLVVTVTTNTPLTNGLVFTNQVDVGNLVDAPVVSATVDSTVLSTPTLEIRKVATPFPAQAGQTLTYTIFYSNTGTAVATGVRITDTLPASVTVGNVTPSPAISVSGQLVWNGATLSPDDGVQVITVTVSVTQPVVSGTLLLNRVDISAGNATSTTFSLNTPVNSLPVLRISKTASQNPVAVGQVLTYTITYTNTGTAHATNVFITDTLDSNVIYQGSRGGTAGWFFAQVPADGISRTVQVTVTVVPTLPNGTILTNLFEIASDQTALASSGFITTPVQAPRLEVTKQVSPTGFVRAGQPIQYTITYTNTGSITASNVLITDTFPLSITNIVSSTSGAVFSGSPTPGTLVWQDAAVPPNGGSGSIIISGNVITSPWPATGQPINNDAVAASGVYTAASSASVQGRPGLPSVINLVVLPSSTITVGTNLSVMTSARDQYGNPVYNGTPLTFTTSLAGSNFANTVMNTNNGGANNVISSTVAGTTTVTVETAGAVGPVTGTTVVTFTAGPAVELVLAATSPQTAGVTFPLTITAVDQFGNRATSFNPTVSLTDTTGSLAGGPVSLVNGQAVANVTVYSATTPAFTTITATGGGITGTIDIEIVPDLANLQLALAVDSPIRVCESGTFTATLTDIHNNPVAGETINFSYPSSVFSPAPNQTDTTNGSGVASVSVTPTSAVTSNLVTAFRSGGPFDNKFVDSLLPSPASTVITVSVSPGSIPANGSATALVSAQVANCAGPVADGTVVTFTVSPPLDLALTPPVTATTSGGTASITITAGALTGTVTITGETAGKTDTTSLTLAEPGAAVLTISKSAVPSGGAVSPGDTITYTVSVENAGSLTATNVVITDDLDAAVQFVSGSNSSSGSFNENSGQITVVTASLGVGQQLTATWQVTVTNVASGTTIDNTANANSDSTGLITSTTVSHQVITTPATSGKVYLPIIIKNCCVPNLIIDSFTVNATGHNPPLVTVVVKNVGQAATTVGFWVDLYVNPTMEPKDLISGPNPGDRRWQRIKTIDRGIAWPVSTLLAPGDTVTLVSTSGTEGKQTNWTAFPAGSYTFYTFADSYDADDNYFVEIFESDEMDNQAKTGPISVVGTLQAANEEPAAPVSPRRDLSR